MSPVRPSIPPFSTCSMLRDADLCALSMASRVLWLLLGFGQWDGYTGKKWGERRRLGLSVYSPDCLPERPVWVGVSPEQFSIPVISSVSSPSDSPLPNFLQAWCGGWVIANTVLQNYPLPCPVVKLSPQILFLIQGCHFCLEGTFAVQQQPTILLTSCYPNPMDLQRTPQQCHCPPEQCHLWMLPEQNDLMSYF